MNESLSPSYSFDPTEAPVILPLRDMLAHDADRLGIVTLRDGGGQISIRDTLEVGPDWLLVVSGHGESEHKVYIAIAAIASVALK